MKPLISVLIDTFNHEQYIDQAVVSAIEQDFPSSEYEILVVDDGSTDRTAEIVRKFEPRVRLLTKQNGGQASAFNLGIRESRADIVAFLDGDDWWAQRKLSVVVSTLELHPEVAAVGHGFQEVREQTHQVIIRVPPESKLLQLSTREHAREAALGWPFLCTSAITVRRSVLESCTPLPEVLFFSADAPIATAGMAMKLRLLPEALCYYRRHSGNLYAFDPKDADRLRRRWEMDDVMFATINRTLLRIGVCAGCISELIDENWVTTNRASLRRFGGNRLKTFRTEMRAFRWLYGSPSPGYVLFKYAVVGAATFLLSPRRFYAVRDWYGKKNLGRFRDWIGRAEPRSTDQ
jgi:glycosyltransferase involved in cell wall biosynthesis